jgi:hypothetical protein
MTAPPSKTQVLLARLAIGLTVGFGLLGLAWHGFSVDTLQRIWQNLLERPVGPMSFRFILQPVMAAVAAGRDGARDARTGRSPYFWTMLTDRTTVGDHLHEGLISTARILLLGLAMDVIYQAVVFETFHPGEAAIVAVLLAFLPYVLLRGPAARIAGWWRARRTAPDAR